MWGGRGLIRHMGLLNTHTHIQPRTKPDWAWNEMCHGALYDQQSCGGCDCFDDLSAPLGRTKMPLATTTLNKTGSQAIFPTQAPENPTGIRVGQGGSIRSGLLKQTCIQT